jgi:sugar phosphate isomerase/epimerase
LFTLTGFGDEISPELGEQLDLLQSEGIHHLELRGVWGKNVLDLTDADAARVQAELARRGCHVSAIGSPIGKIKIDEPFAPHLERFRRALDLAEFFSAPYVRLFSFYVDGQPERHRAEVMARLQALAEVAAGRKVQLAHENEHGIYGDVPERCLDIVRTLNNPQWVSVFDPANYALEGVHPFTRGFPLLADTIGYLHIKDAHMDTRVICPAGEGDGQVAEVLGALKACGWSGFLSLEPHLTVAGKSGGITAPDLFCKAIRALKNVIAGLQ